MRNQAYCYPLTLSDFVSRYVITCEALDSTELHFCFAVFEEAFQEYGSNLLQQQEKFDHFREEFNYERPHQTLQMKCPADIHTKSQRKYQGFLTLLTRGMTNLF